MASRNPPPPPTLFGSHAVQTKPGTARDRCPVAPPPTTYGVTSLPAANAIQRATGRGGAIIQRMEMTVDQYLLNYNEDEDEDFTPTEKITKADHTLEDYDEVEMGEDKTYLFEQSMFHVHVGYQFEEKQNAKIFDSDPGNTKAIDDYNENTGVAISLKTVDLMNFYQSGNAEATLLKTMDKYLETLTDFDSIKFGDVTIGVREGCTHQVTRFILRIAIPSAFHEDPSLRQALMIWQQKYSGMANSYNRLVPVMIEVVPFRGDWRLGTGYAFEKLQNATIHGNEPSNFPTIDSLEGRTAVSLKTMDLVHNYQTDHGLEQAWHALKGYLDVLAQFNHGKGNGILVSAQDFDQKELRVAIPKGTYEKYKWAFEHAFKYVQTLNNLPAPGIRAIKKPISLKLVEYETGK